MAASEKITFRYGVPTIRDTFANLFDREAFASIERLDADLHCGAKRAEPFVFVLLKKAWTLTNDFARRRVAPRCDLLGDVRVQMIWKRNAEGFHGSILSDVARIHNNCE